MIGLSIKRPVAVAMEVALAHIGSELRLFSRAPGARNSSKLEVHRPSFQARSERAAQGQFEEMLDPKTGRTRVRMVDTATEHYKIARRYMLRLRRDDFQDESEIAKYAAVAGLSAGEFRGRFEYLVKDEAPPLSLDIG